MSLTYKLLFLFQYKFYKQPEGPAKGCPLSPIFPHIHFFVLVFLIYLLLSLIFAALLQKYPLRENMFSLLETFFWWHIYIDWHLSPQGCSHFTNYEILQIIIIAGGI